ncbi:MAG: hypothetical protein Q9208_004497 [Pyrenodesmia sp. 3 TL-2023]
MDPRQVQKFPPDKPFIQPKVPWQKDINDPHHPLNVRRANQLAKATQIPHYIVWLFKIDTETGHLTHDRDPGHRFLDGANGLARRRVDEITTLYIPREGPGGEIRILCSTEKLHFSSLRLSANNIDETAIHFHLTKGLPTRSAPLSNFAIVEHTYQFPIPDRIFPRMQVNGATQPNDTSNTTPTVYTALLTVTNTNTITLPVSVRQSSEFTDVNLANREALKMAEDWIDLPITNWDLFSAGASESGATRICGLLDGVSIVCIVRAGSPTPGSDSEASLVLHSRRLANFIASF